MVSCVCVTSLSLLGTFFAFSSTSLSLSLSLSTPPCATCAQLGRAAISSRPPFATQFFQTTSPRTCDLAFFGVGALQNSGFGPWYRRELVKAGNPRIISMAANAVLSLSPPDGLSRMVMVSRSPSGFAFPSDLLATGQRTISRLIGRHTLKSGCTPIFFTARCHLVLLDSPRPIT